MSSPGYPADVDSDGSSERSTDLDSESNNDSGSGTEGQYDTSQLTTSNHQHDHYNRNPTGKNQHASVRKCDPIDVRRSSNRLTILPAPLDEDLANLLRELNKNNITGYEAIMEKTAEKGYPLK